ncbi:MAG: DUF4135 domain-containing protein [Lachnospiraceae bacterium]|nr:DUF4135 domain-containing protein [Lachnospiraceae bacterium]
MNTLFTEEDIRSIFDRSLIPGASPENREEAYRVFADHFRYLLEFSACEDESEFLFGKYEPVNPAGILFSFMFNGIRHYFRDRVDTARYLPHAFADWQTSFSGALGDLFGPVLSGELQSMAGTITSPTMKWMEEKAMPFIKNGAVLRSMAVKYPLFIRQTVTFIWLQIRHIEEIMDAVENELESVFFTIFGTRDMPGIKKVSASLSDRHNGGRSVHIIEFEDGRKIVYKPAHAGINRAFAAWMAYISEKGGESPFMLPLSIDTEKGSFVQFIEAKPLAKPEEAAVFFRRMGFLMGIIYLLHGNDLHMENIIAVGSEPVIIDLETMIAPKGCLNDRLLNGIGFYSVMYMALLPTSQTLPGFIGSPFAGLCDTRNGNANLPVYEGRPISGRRHIEAICRGFENALKTVRDHIEEATQKAVDIFKGTKVRMVLRPTRLYQRLLQGLATEKCLGDLPYYKSLLDRKTFSDNKLISKEECQAIVEAEQKAIEILDTPHFSDSLTESMIRAMCEDWKKQDDERIAREIERIRFSLSGIAVDHGKEMERFIPEGLAIDHNGLKRLAHICAAMLEHSVYGTIVTKDQTQVLLSETALLADTLLDGNLGSLVALGAYKILFGSDTVIEKGLEKALEHLVDPSYMAPALVPSEMGLADGTAGYVIGMNMCREMALISEDIFSETLKKVGGLVKSSLPIRYTKPSVLYSSMDMIYALSKLPQKFITEELLALKELILSSVTNWSEYKDFSEDKLIKEVEKAMLPYSAEAESMDKVLMPCRNNSLRMGNGGKLYAATNALQRHEDETTRKMADQLCAYLSTQYHVYENVGLPGDCFEIGLLHGVPGILYSICRYLRPDLIPSL